MRDFSGSLIFPFYGPRARFAVLRAEKRAAFDFCPFESVCGGFNQWLGTCVRSHVKMDVGKIRGFSRVCAFSRERQSAFCGWVRLVSFALEVLCVVFFYALLSFYVVEYSLKVFQPKLNIFHFKLNVQINPFRFDFLSSDENIIFH